MTNENLVRQEHIDQSTSALPLDFTEITFLYMGIRERVEATIGL